MEPIKLPFLLHESHPFLIMLCQLQPKIGGLELPAAWVSIPPGQFKTPQNRGMPLLSQRSTASVIPKQEMDIDIKIVKFSVKNRQKI